MPEAILVEIDAELVRSRQMAAVELAAGSWKAKDYPELSKDREVNNFVRKMRQEGDARLKKQG